MRENGPQCDPLPNVRRKMLDSTIKGGGGGAIRYPVPQNAMMNLRKSPMDMNTNRYEKLVLTPSRGAEGASSDCVTIEQCQSAYRQSTKTTVAEVYMNLADKPELTRYQGTAVAAEGAGTDGTTNVRGRSIDCDKRRTTVMKLPTDCVKFTEPKFARVSPVVAEMAHTDGTRVMQHESDDQKSIKTTKMQMPMDYLEIPEPTLPQVFLDLAEEARNVKVESGRSCYTEEVQSQGTRLTRPVFVTVMEYSPPVLKKGALGATGVSTEMIPIMSSAGRRETVDRSGLVAHRIRPSSRSCSVWMRIRWEPFPRAQWALTECFQRVIRISRWLMAQWAGLSHTAQWDQTAYFPRVILIGQWLMAQWANRLY